MYGDCRRARAYMAGVSEKMMLMSGKKLYYVFITFGYNGDVGREPGAHDHETHNSNWHVTGSRRVRCARRPRTQ